MPEPAQALAAHGPDAGDGADGQGAQAAGDVGLGERREAAGLLELGGELGEQPGGADADRTGEAELSTP